jgi:hypothetical protein
MKKYLLALALFGLLSSVYAADFGISVNSPYLVTEWKCGQDLNIQWTKWGDWSKLNLDPGNRNVRVLLVKAVAPRVRVVPKILFDNVPATDISTKILWKIQGVANGEYHIIVQTINKLYKGKSEVFIIKDCLQLPINKRKL